MHSLNWMTRLQRSSGLRHERPAAAKEGLGMKERLERIFFRVMFVVAILLFIKIGFTLASFYNPGGF